MRKALAQPAPLVTICDDARLGKILLLCSTPYSYLLLTVNIEGKQLLGRAKPWALSRGGAKHLPLTN